MLVVTAWALAPSSGPKKLPTEKLPPEARRMAALREAELLEDGDMCVVDPEVP